MQPVTRSGCPVSDESETPVILAADIEEVEAAPSKWSVRGEAAALARVYNQSFLMMCKFSPKIVFSNKNTPDVLHARLASAGNRKSRYLL